VKTRRKAIRLSKDERQSLVGLYLEKAIPVDQYEERERELLDSTESWHLETGRSDPPSAVLHYMRNQRKQKLWVRLGSNHVKRNAGLDLTADDLTALLAIVRENVSEKGLGSDEIAYSPELGKLIAKEFSLETGRFFSPGELIAEVTAIRKRGLLDPVEKVLPKQSGMGFDDLDSAIG